jgi:hypothetical protein
LQASLENGGGNKEAVKLRVLRRLLEPEKKKGLDSKPKPAADTDKKEKEKTKNGVTDPPQTSLLVKLCKDQAKEEEEAEKKQAQEAAAALGEGADAEKGTWWHKTWFKLGLRLMGMSDKVLILSLLALLV